jgi:hypothetical protein
LVAAALFAISANTQYVIDPDSVDLQTRTSWCTTQKSTCPLLCLQLKADSSTTVANDCDPATLSYECICGNGLSPNASEYSQTLPYFLCTEFGTRCVNNCNADPTCQFNCRKDNPCGAQDPRRVNVTTTSSQAATATGAGAGSTGTDGVVYTTLGGDAEPTETSGSSSDKSNGSQTVLDLGRSYGLAVVFAGLFAGFALVM